MANIYEFPISNDTKVLRHDRQWRTRIAVTWKMRGNFKASDSDARFIIYGMCALH